MHVLPINVRGYDLGVRCDNRIDAPFKLITVDVAGRFPETLARIRYVLVSLTTLGSGWKYTVWQIGKQWRLPIIWYETGWGDSESHWCYTVIMEGTFSPIYPTIIGNIFTYFLCSCEFCINKRRKTIYDKRLLIINYNIYNGKVLMIYIGEFHFVISKTAILTHQFRLINIFHTFVIIKKKC